MTTRFKLLLVATLVGGGCTGPTEPKDPAPGVLILENTVTQGEVVAGEAMVYRVRLDGLFNYRVSFHADAGGLNDTLVLVATDSATGDVVGELRSVTGSGADAPSQFFLDPVEQESTVRIVVRGATRADHGAFAFAFGRPNTSNEHSVDSLVLGDSLTDEGLDGPGDVDTWRLRANAGDELVVIVGYSDVTLNPYGQGEFFGQVSFGTATANLVSSTYLAYTASDARHVTVIPVPATGEFFLRLASPTAVRGRFNLLVVRRDRGPESAPPTFAIGDTLVDAIDEMADIDEFSFQATQGDELMFNVSTSEAWQTGLDFRLLAGEDVIRQQVLENPVLSLDSVGGTRWLVPATGTYRVVVHAPPTLRRPPVTGPYRFELYRVNRAPEILDSILPFGTMGYGETIERRGDIDEFVIPLDSQVVFGSNLVTQMGSRAGSITGGLVAPIGWELGVWSDSGPALSRDSTFGSPNRIFGQYEGGPHRLTFEGSTSGITYGFRTYAIDARPETVSADLPIGDWVDGETLGFVGDFDEFRLPVVAGRMYAFELDAAALPARAIRASSAVFGPRELESGPNGLPFLVADSTGTARITVANGVDRPLQTGAYRLRVHQTNPNPETTDSVLAIGESVSSETLAGYADTDDFYLTASDADSLRLTLGFAPAMQQTVQLDVIDVATGERTWGMGGNTLFTYDWRPSLPGARLYRLRITSGSPLRTSPVGAYQFSIIRIP